MKKILILIGTRPNFIKVTQFKKLAGKYGLDIQIVHSGQHYDHKMSGVFFEQFGLVPDYILDTPREATPGELIAHIIVKLSEYTRSIFYPDLMLVVGDVNSTLAGAIFANKAGIPLGHIESGLRSRDFSMPEEINRILTDKITDCFFITEQDGYDNLVAEGVSKDKLFFVGNTMIDTLVAFEEQIEKASILDDLGIETGSSYVLMTMHRPATVDNENELRKLLKVIRLITQKNKLVFPIHPRTQMRMEAFGIFEELVSIEGVILCPPIGYFEFQKLIKNASYIVTDSGGIQEETTFRQIPCLTLRPNTERPSTITIGSNTLVTSFDEKEIIQLIGQIESKHYKKGGIPEYWDGRATERIIKAII